MRLMDMSAAFLILGGVLAAQAANVGPRTVAEASGFRRTSTHEETRAWVERVRGLPRGGRLGVVRFGESEEGRVMEAVVVGEPPVGGVVKGLAGEKLRVLVMANIHGGEVAGKEAVLVLLRELAQGRHEELLEHCVIVWVPDFNPDGNDDMKPGNRPGQNGPLEGMGRRANAKGLDLNRDFLKAESAEVRGMLGLFRKWDPHLFLDLHTTNGSPLGYHLTYAGSLSPNVDRELGEFVRRRFLPEVRRAVWERHWIEVHDYGNFGRYGPPGKEPRYRTFDHRPRFASNYYGLRNRVSVLSEAYSYRTFEERIRASRAFVLENLRAAVRHREEVRQLCAAADQRQAFPSILRPVEFGYATELEPGVKGEIHVGEILDVREEGQPFRREVRPGGKRIEATLQVGFVAKKKNALPQAWALWKPSKAVLANLLRHGIEVRTLGGEAKAKVEMFEPTKASRPRRPFQGHRLVRISGQWTSGEVTLPAGTVIVPGAQRLAMLAAQLLEAESEDSLTVWNFFDEQIRLPGAEGKGDTEGPAFPVVRVLSDLAAKGEAMRLADVVPEEGR